MSYGAVDLWLTDGFETSLISPSILNKLLDGQRVLLDCKYGNLFLKSKKSHFCLCGKNCIPGVTAPVLFLPPVHFLVPTSTQLPMQLPYELQQQITYITTRGLSLLRRCLTTSSLYQRLGRPLEGQGGAMRIQNVRLKTHKVTS